MNENKQKTISDAILSIEKRFGRGSILDFETGIKDVEFISSGSIGLDYALGGGFPRGRIIEVYGPESSGKCLTEDSYIQTSRGFKSVQEIFEETENDLTISQKEVEYQYSSLVNRLGQLEDTSHLVYNGRQPIYKIRTQTGFLLKRTYKHPLLVVSKNGNFIWKYSGVIQEGDYLVNHRSRFFGIGERDLDTCYSIGLLLADGYLGGTISISNDDPCIKQFIETKMSQSLDFSRCDKSPSDSISGQSFGYDFRLNLKGQRSNKTIQKHFYEKFDLKVGVAKTKYFPKWIRELNEECMSAVIRGYMDCESYICETGLEVCSASYTLLYQLKLMLSQFGIVSFFGNSGKVKGYEQNDYYNLYIYGEDFQLYIDKIGTDSLYRRNQIQQYVDTRSSVVQIQTNYKHIPFIEELVKDLYYQQENRGGLLRELLEDIFSSFCKVTFTRLKKILELCEESRLKTQLSELLDYSFERVVHVEKVEETIRTFDFIMSKTSSFTADGCINHNSTLGLHAIAEAQKEGGVAAYLDSEHAFDSTYAKNLGVDLSKETLLFSQPDNGEQALEIAEILIRTGKIDIIVIDSVAALIPAAELAGDMGDSKMGLHARLMSQALRKICGAVSKSNTIVIFINQLRDKIGIQFGSPETTTGGNALKFYASQRLDIRKTAMNKDGEEAVSNTVKVKVVKNKVAPPARFTSFDIVYGKGINKIAEIVSLGVELGIIKKSGSWFSYGETKLGQGSKAVEDILNDNPELQDELTALIRHKLKS